MFTHLKFIKILIFCNLFNGFDDLNIYNVFELDCTQIYTKLKQKLDSFLIKRVEKLVIITIVIIISTTNNLISYCISHVKYNTIDTQKHL